MYFHDVMKYGKGRNSFSLPEKSIRSYENESAFFHFRRTHLFIPFMLRKFLPGPEMRDYCEARIRKFAEIILASQNSRPLYQAQK